MNEQSESASSTVVPVEEERRRRLRLNLIASQSPDLLPLLEAAVGAVVAGAYRIDQLLAVGGQFCVWLATDLDHQQTVILKQARFDYSRPVRYGRAETNRLRQAIRKEHDVLQADRGQTLPRPLALLVIASPVPAAGASPVLAKNEVFVAEEYVRGLTWTELALRVWPEQAPELREAQAAQLATEFVAFWERLQGNGWHYGDLSSDNLLIESATGRLRVVDGGSAVAHAETVIVPGYTPAFTTPRLFAAASAGQPIPSSLAAVLPLLGKVLHFALTRREAFNGHLPDLGEPALESYSPQCRATLTAILELDARPELLPQARESLREWCEVVEKFVSTGSRNAFFPP